MKFFIFFYIHLIYFLNLIVEFSSLNVLLYFYFCHFLKTKKNYNINWDN